MSRAVVWPALLVLPIFGQQTVNSASVSGRVTDPSGALMPGARVVARQLETNLTSTAVTDAEGWFRFPYLKLGPYEIKVHHEGFADVSRPITVSVGSAFDITVTLSIESAQSRGSPSSASA